jgi:hypothetical protein
VVKHLPRDHEIQNSNPTTIKKKKKKNSALLPDCLSMNIVLPFTSYDFSKPSSLLFKIRIRTGLIMGRGGL